MKPRGISGLVLSGTKNLSMSGNGGRDHRRTHGKCLKHGEPESFIEGKVHYCSRFPISSPQYIIWNPAKVCVCQALQ